MSGARLLETRLEYRRLSGELKAWFEARKDEDNLQQYFTQLRVLKEALVNLLERLEAKLDAAAAGGQSDGQIYRACREYDRYLVCVRYIWDYYREKFTQRDEDDAEGEAQGDNDDALLGAVKAADEVVWSCYRTPFLQGFIKARGIRPGPAPLPFVTPWATPMALFRDKPLRQVGVGELPEELRAAILACLDALPVPVIALPRDCVHSPWLLVHAAHEVGHHIHRAIAPGGKALESFKGALRAAVTRDGKPKEPDSPPERWEANAEELFADLFSVLMMGPWVVSALAELLGDTEEAMLDDGVTGYPPARVRLALMAQAAVSAGASTAHKALDGRLPPAAGGQNPGPSTAAARRAAADLRLVPEVVEAVVKVPLTGRTDTLAEWCGWQEGYAKSVAAFRGTLLDPNQANVLQPSLYAPRLVASGAVPAWETFRATKLFDAAEAGKTPEERERAALERQRGFARRVCDTVVKNREAGMRDLSTADAPDSAKLGELLTDTLLSAGG